MNTIQTACFLISLLFVLSRCAKNPEIIATKLDGRILERVFCGKNNEILLIRTENNTVYRSENYGQSFTQITESFEKSNEEILSESSQIGEISNILKSEADEKLLIFVGIKGFLWSTQNCAGNISPLNRDFPISRIKLHPTEKNWILASSPQKCNAEKNECHPNAFSLYISLDLGANWKKIAENILHFEWPFNLAQINNGIEKERIFVLKYEKNRVNLVKSDDFFGNKTILLYDVTEFTLRANYLFAIQKSRDSTEAILMTSTLQEQFEKFRIAVFTKENLKPHSFHILDTSESTVFLLVTHGISSPFGDLYVSDSSGTQFSLSLKNLIKDTIHGADFTKISGIEGIYIANALTEKAAIEYERQKEEEENEEEEWENEEKNWDAENSGSMTNSHAKKKITTLLVQNNMQTFITFNKGGSWRYLRPPKADYKNKILHCAGDEECSLHLYIKKGTSMPLHSHKNAHGLILANGNIGRALFTESDTKNVYFSRDGGLTWLEIAKGFHVFDLADHGGVLAMAGIDKDKSVSLKYSWNEAETWEKMKLSNQNGTVVDIFTEPNSSSQNFLIQIEFYETDPEEETIQKFTTIYSINFEPMHIRPCKGPNFAGSPDSDYEIWAPYGGRLDEKCILGHRISYVRRKRSAECYNGVKFEHPISIENCECTEEDYECDYGFARKNQLSNSPCIAQVNISYTPPSTCTLGGSYSVTSGYRKIPGDTCMNGILHEPIVLSCAYSVMTGSNLAFFGIISVIGIILMAMCCSFKSDNKKQKADLREIKYGKIHEKSDQQDEETLNESPT